MPYLILVDIIVSCTRRSVESVVEFQDSYFIGVSFSKLKEILKSCETGEGNREVKAGSD